MGPPLIATKWTKVVVIRHETSVRATIHPRYVDAPPGAAPVKYYLNQEVMFNGDHTASNTPWRIVNILVPLFPSDDFVYVLENGPSRIFQSESVLNASVSSTGNSEAA